MLSQPPVEEPINTIDPPPPSIMAGTVALQVSARPRKLTPMTRSHLFHRHVQELDLFAADAGIGEDDVQASEMIQGRLRHCRAIFRAGHISADGDGIDADFSGDRLRAILM